MYRRGIGICFLFLWFLYPSFFSFAKEVYRWTDEKGNVHFTDDSSQIPAQYQNKTEKTEMKEEVSKPAEKPVGKQGGKTSKPSTKSNAKSEKTKDDTKE